MMSSTAEVAEARKKIKTFASIGKKNEYDSQNKKQLARHLDEWFKRTRLPVVALILDETKDKQPFVRYAESPFFQDFYRDKEVVEKFVKVAVDGLQKEEASEGIEENAAKMVLHADVLNLQIGMKLNLIGQLVQSMNWGTMGISQLR